MIVLLENIKDLLDDELTVTQRGILITALLCRDKKSSVTLAKFKEYVNYRDIQEDLIYLHEVKLIEWSGYKAAIKSRKQTSSLEKVVDIIDFMNSTFGTSYKSTTQATVSAINQRLEEYSVYDIKLVIANRWKEWKDDPEMSQYLAPTTIFRPSKFEKYLQHARLTHKGESILEASKIDLRDGQEITLEISKSFVDSEVYKIELINLNEQGERVRNPVSLSKTGKDIKLSLKILDNSIAHGGYKEFKYIYKTR